MKYSAAARRRGEISMWANTIQKLLFLFIEGKFVNADTETLLFEFLEDDPTNIARINTLLAGLGVHIVRTSNGRTWFPAYKEMNDEVRKRIEETVIEHKKKLRHLISFFRLSLGAIGGMAPQGGVRFRASTLSESIHSNTNLIDALKLLCSRLSISNDSVQAMTAAMLKWAEKQDLIKSTDASQGEYQFTGKTDWANDMIESFDECIEQPMVDNLPETAQLNF